MVESYFRTFNITIIIINKGVYQVYTNLFYVLLTVNNVKPLQLSTKVRVCGDFVGSKTVYLPSWITYMQSIVSNPMLHTVCLTMQRLCYICLFYPTSVLGAHLCLHSSWFWLEFQLISKLKYFN